MHISYDQYHDQILGGWIGKSMGGAMGARWEGYKGWIEIGPDEMFPKTMPPNDDLDLQVLWLKVLEEKGAALTADDMAAAWQEGCWYPFNEYGIFRRNWQLGIHPPMSGRFTNQFWETGEGSPIRAEVWGYVFPGAPDLAAHYAGLDGSLDHTEQSTGAEKMLAAMSSMAFFVPDVRRLAAMFRHYLPVDTPIARLTETAFQAYDQGLSLRDARDRLMALEGLPEACDSQINVPFTFLGLLYGGNDLEKVMRAALACGYDTDCTVASAAALVGQILGARRIPAGLKDAIGDELVMGIEYRREEMTLSALARDTARVGVLLTEAAQTGITIDGAPVLAPLPDTARAPGTALTIAYHGLPVVAPGETVDVTVRLEGEASECAQMEVEGPPGWRITPTSAVMDAVRRTVDVAITAPRQPARWPMRNLFRARLQTTPPVEIEFGVVGAGLWKLLGVYYDELPPEGDPVGQARRFNHHFISLERAYIPEPEPDVDALYRAWSQKLGRPALVPSYEHEVDASRLVGLRGPFIAYFARTVVSPVERDAWVVIGNTDGFKLWVNGEPVTGADEAIEWTPFNTVAPVHLKQGANRLLLKLARRDRGMRFTLGFRGRTKAHGDHHNVEDWLVDLSDE